MYLHPRARGPRPGNYWYDYDYGCCYPYYDYYYRPYWPYYDYPYYW